MAINLHPDQEKWLEARVLDGDFASVEAGARQLLGERIAELAVTMGEASEDRAWVKPYINDGLFALDNGSFVSLEDHKANNAALLASLIT